VSYEITPGRPGTDEPVALTLGGIPVILDPDDSSRVTVLLPPAVAAQVGRDLARGTGGGWTRAVLDNALTEIQRLVGDRDHWKQEAHAQNDEGGYARDIVADVADLVGVDLCDVPGSKWDPSNMARVVDAVKALTEQLREVTEERDRAGRRVAWLTRRLKVTPSPFAVDAARLREERDEARAARDTWKALAERNDVGSSRHQMEIRRLRLELDAADNRIRLLTSNLDTARRTRDDEASEEADALRATIVRQAQEITELKGESE
jgi:hypothetical protein